MERPLCAIFIDYEHFDFSAGTSRPEVIFGAMPSILRADKAAPILSKNIIVRTIEWPGEVVLNSLNVSMIDGQFFDRLPTGMFLQAKLWQNTIGSVLHSHVLIKPRIEEEALSRIYEFVAEVDPETKMNPERRMAFHSSIFEGIPGIEISDHGIAVKSQARESVIIDENGQIVGDEGKKRSIDSRIPSQLKFELRGGLTVSVGRRNMAMLPYELVLYSDSYPVNLSRVNYLASEMAQGNKESYLQIQKIADLSLKFTPIEA